MDLRNKTRVLIGKGKLPEFSEDYMKIQMTEGLEAISSQLFPGGMSNIDSNSEFSEFYEWVIYYRENPNHHRQNTGAPVVKAPEKPKLKLEL